MRPRGTLPPIQKPGPKPVVPKPGKGMDDSAQKPGPKPGKGMGDSAKKLEDKSQRKLRQGHPVRVTKPRVFKPPVKAGIGGGNGKPFWV